MEATENTGEHCSVLKQQRIYISTGRHQEKQNFKGRGIQQKLKGPQKKQEIKVVKSSHLY